MNSAYVIVLSLAICLDSSKYIPYHSSLPEVIVIKAHLSNKFATNMRIILFINKFFE